MDILSAIVLLVIYIIGFAITLHNTRYAFRYRRLVSMTFIVLDLFRAKGASRYVLVVAMLVLWPIYWAAVAICIVGFLFFVGAIAAPDSIKEATQKLKLYIKGFSNDIAGDDR